MIEEQNEVSYSVIEVSKTLKDVLSKVATAINVRLMSEKLPSLNYRISADYGKVEVARSKSLQNEDLFGPAMKVTAKINSKALTNGLAIGQALYNRVKGMEEYSFAKSDEVAAGISGDYHAYHVKSKGSRNVLNPFKRMSAG